MMVDLARAAAVVARELLLFAGAGFAIGGASDLLVDLAWLVRAGWRRLTVYRRHERATVATLPPPAPLRFAVFVPAWREEQVIAATLARMVAAWPDDDWRVYLGTYPNDPATAAAARAVDSTRVRVVVGPVAGPTTKAGCLNTLWRALEADERAGAPPVDAVVLHDAEDVVHPAELRLFAALLPRFDLLQLPVRPLPDPGSRWVAGHYLDEFAESHARTLVVREAVGAGLPLAGVGCAVARELVERVARARGGLPFDADSLVEDYEFGLRARSLGARHAFVRIRDRAGGELVAVRSHFPATLDAAVRQKARWIAGIALSGWDRLGWQGNWAERWMRADDRRAVLAALVLAAGYAGAMLAGLLAVVARFFPVPAIGFGPAGELLLSVTTGLLAWRLGLRFAIVAREQGWREGLRAVPRALVANVVAVAAARRAVMLYLRARREGRVRWDKTEHAPMASGDR